MNPKQRPKKTLRKWHLAMSEEENSIVELEWSLLRLMTAFNRFNENAITSISGHSLNAGEINMLHVIRMHDTPKSASILASLLNRDDYSNIQYGLKKLRELKLIRIHSKSKAKQYTYEITSKGVKLTDTFVTMRSEHITEPIQSIHNWEDRFDELVIISRLLTGIFEEAAREALAYWEEDNGDDIYDQ